MSVGFSFIGIILAVLVVLGLGALVVWLCRQVSGAKGSIDDAKHRQREMEQPLDPDSE